MPAFLLVRSWCRISLPVFGIFLVFSWLVCATLAEARQAEYRSDARSSAKKRIDKTKVSKAKAYKTKSDRARERSKQQRAKRKPAPKVVQAKAFFCVDVKRNQTLLARNPDKQLPVASLTKLVTALVTLDHMPLDRKLTVPDHIKKVPKSVVGLQAGDKLSVEELLHGLLISSGNDCAETLACEYQGGKDSFVRAMNKKARALGATSTTFYTPSGLDRKIVRNSESKDSEDVDSNLSTARDISRIARVAFSNAKIRSICRKQAHVIPSTTQSKGYAVRNTNKLLRDNLPIVGGKTGYTSRAGHCLATELAPGGKDILLIVVLGSPDHFGDTRLVYHKALVETRKVSDPTVNEDTQGSKRIASHGPRGLW
jgi:serine-type D-Ala-D-Ala endopeptidase (penicillin-binding protein 7)